MIKGHPIQKQSKIGEIILYAREDHLDLKIRNCRGFDMERMQRLNQFPCIIKTRKLPEDYSINETNSMRDMPGFDELIGLVSKTRSRPDLIGHTEGTVYHRMPSVDQGQREDEKTISFEGTVYHRMPSVDTVSKPMIAMLRVIIQKDDSDKLIIRKSMQGFSKESCMHLQDDYLFSDLKKFVVKGLISIDGTIFS